MSPAMWSDFQTESGVAAALAGQLGPREPFEMSSGRRDNELADLAVFVLADGDGRETIETIDLDRFQPQPARKTGTVTLATHESFTTYVARHADTAHTTLWGVPKQGRLVAVINDHSTNPGDAGWGDHVAILQLQQTDDWQHWTSNNNRMVCQADFADHLEDGADCIVKPTAADMLEIAQHFTAKNNVNFRSAHRVDNGEVQLVYEETVQAKAGSKGTMTIPTTFELGLAPFEGAGAYRVTARFRYRLVDGRLSLGYKLVRPDAIIAGAFNDVATEIASALELPVLIGTPRSR